LLLALRLAGRVMQVATFFFAAFVLGGTRSAAGLPVLEALCAVLAVNRFTSSATAATAATKATVPWPDLPFTIAAA
jgi:hypothetical protein